MILPASSDEGASGSLLSDPATEPPTQLPRLSSEYTNLSDKFVLSDRVFHRQYAHIYAARLWSLRDKVEKAAEEKWGDDVPVRKLCELKAGEECIVIGTMFKHMQLKPSILHELCEDNDLMPLPSRSKFTDESDYLLLEDELQRIKLVSNIDVDTYVTGVILAVHGCEPEDDLGKFHVTDYCFQQLPPQKPLPEPEVEKFVCLVSGLEFGGQMEQTLTTQLFVDLLTGQLGDGVLQESMAKVVRVVIAGNSLSANTQDKGTLTKAKYLTKNVMAGTVEAIKTFDDVLTQLAASVEVDIMAGDQDPVNYTLPQQPLHRCMFPQAGGYSTLYSVTNPYHFTVDGVSFLGTSGQPVNDMYKFTGMEDHLNMLEKTITWGHLAPTAPDTLGCYPYSDIDPFIIEQCPHVYFAGNMPSFQDKIYKGGDGQAVRLVTIPRFSRTQTCVLVNLKTLECLPVTLGENLAADQTSPEVEK